MKYEVNKRSICIVIIAAALGLAAAVCIFIYSGFYNVAATSEHWGITKILMQITMQRSVAFHAKEVTVPPRPLSPKEGFPDFNEMCVNCHGAPGILPGEVGKGLNPRPPDLAIAAKELSLSELFWIIKNGIKMTGMPAFGPTHTEERLWSITAFVKRLPALPASDYAELKQSLSTLSHTHGVTGH